MDVILHVPVFGQACLLPRKTPSRKTFFLTFPLADVPYIYEGSCCRIFPWELGEPDSAGYPARRRDRPRDDAPDAKVDIHRILCNVRRRRNVQALSWDRGYVSQKINDEGTKPEQPTEVFHKGANRGLDLLPVNRFARLVTDALYVGSVADRTRRAGAKHSVARFPRLCRRCHDFIARSGDHALHRLRTIDLELIACFVAAGSLGINKAEAAELGQAAAMRVGRLSQRHRFGSDDILHS